MTMMKMNIDIPPLCFLSDPSDPVSPKDPTRVPYPPKQSEEKDYNQNEVHPEKPGELNPGQVVTERRIWHLGGPLFSQLRADSAKRMAVCV